MSFHRSDWVTVQMLRRSGAMTSIGHRFHLPYSARLTPAATRSCSLCARDMQTLFARDTL